MTLKDKILRRLKGAHFEVVKDDFTDQWWWVTVKYKARYCPWDCLKGLDLSDGSNGTISWDINSIKNRILQDIPSSNIKIYRLDCGQLPIFTRQFRRTYLLDKQSSIKTTRKKKNGSQTIRPIFVYMGYSLEYLIKNAKKIIDKYHLKKYTFEIIEHTYGKFGGYIGTGYLT